MKIKKILSILTPISVIGATLSPLSACAAETKYFNVITADSSSQVKFYGTQSESVYKGRDISNLHYSFDHNSYRINQTESDILIGNKSVKADPDVVWKTSDIQIPKDYIDGDVIVRIIVEPCQLTNSWEEIIESCNLYENGTISDTQFAQRFKLKHRTLSTLDDLLGCTINLKINGFDHLIRIVDYNHEHLTSDPTKTAALTFDTVTLLTGTDGQLMSCVWDSRYPRFSYYYLDSILRANLSGGGSGTPSFEKSVFSMLPELLQTNIKQVIKHVTNGENREVVDYNDVLFAPTWYELGNNPRSGSWAANLEGTPYRYWNGCPWDSYWNPAKINQNNVNYSYWLPTAVSFTEKTLSEDVWTISSKGGHSTDKMYHSNNIAFAFCI